MTTPSTAYGTSPLNFNGVSAPINFRHKRADIVLQNGDNNNIARNDANYLRITGPSSAFSISGFDTPLSGMMLYVQVAISQQLTIKYQALSSVKNQIDTLTYADVVITSTPCVITFIYDSSSQKWVYGGLQAKIPSLTSINGEAAKLAMIGKYTFSGAVALSNPQHAMLGDYIFLVAETDNNVVAFNASDVHHISWISNLSLAGIVAGQTAGAGKYLYVWTFSTPNYTLHSIDVSNPYAMVAVGTFAAATRGLFGNTHMSIWSRANILYLTYVSATAGVGTTRITTLNITNPAAITLVGDYQPGSDTPVSADVSGQYVYCATSQNHLYVLDYSTPATPTVTSTTTLPAVNPNGDMVAGMDYLYWSSTSIYPVNIINPAAPVLGTGVASDPLNPHAQGYVPVRMMLNGSYLVCFLRSNADAIISVFSLNTPMAPVFLTRVEDDFVFNSANAYLYSMFVKGRFVYCSGKDESANAAIYVYGF